MTQCLDAWEARASLLTFADAQPVPRALRLPSTALKIKIKIKASMCTHHFARHVVLISTVLTL